MKNGRIIKIISNQYTVLTDQEKIVATVRGKFRKDKLSPVVGDLVIVNTNDLIIEKILPRINYLDRPIVANVNVALIVTSVKQPDLSLNLLDKLLSIISIKKIEPIICFSKMDLLTNKELEKINEIIKYYQLIGYKVFINDDIKNLKKYLKNKIVVVTGQTGAGKSTLLNRLDKTLNLETKPISKVLNRGVHTTRHVELYEIDDFFIVDTPGFSAIDFNDITKEELINSFKEFKNYNCKYKDCTHNKELNCSIKEAVNNQKILLSRYNNYLKFLGEVNENNRKLYK